MLNLLLIFMSDFSTLLINLVANIKGASLAIQFSCSMLRVICHLRVCDKRPLQSKLKLKPFKTAFMNGFAGKSTLCRWR
jgi:hypothetical protein